MDNHCTWNSTREYQKQKTKDGIGGTSMGIYIRNRIPFQRTISNHTLENVIKIYRVMAIRTKRFLPFIRYARWISFTDTFLWMEWLLVSPQFRRQAKHFITPNRVSEFWAQNITFNYFNHLFSAPRSKKYRSRSFLWNSNSNSNFSERHWYRYENKSSNSLSNFQARYNFDVSDFMTQ